MANDLTVWGVGTSRTIRAHWMLMELGLEYEFHPIRSRTGETLTAEFLQLNPRHKIPVLRHGSFVLTESAAIVQYLSETFAKPDQFYVPTDARARATLNEWCYFIMSELDAGSLYVMRRHDGLREIYGDAPVAVESAQQYFLHNLEAMAPQVARGGRYLFGDRLSTADILLMTCLVWADIVGIRMSETFAEYQKRVSERPAFKAAMQRNFAG
jgi:glutathione S-transferase